MSYEKKAMTGQELADKRYGDLPKKQPVKEQTEQVKVQPQAAMGKAKY